MLPQDIPYERALASPPSMELDMFVWQNILEGPEDMLSPDNVGRMPALSRRYGDGQLVLLKAIHELGTLSVAVDSGYFHEEMLNGFITRKTPCVTWRIEAGTIVGYGRSFEEALCKLLIVAKYKHGKG